MPYVDWSTVPDSDALPDGEYLSQVSEVKIDKNKDNHEMWKLRLKVGEGKCKGRLIFDNITWSPAAMNRTKLVLGRLGVPVTGAGDYQPKHILNKWVYVTVITETYPDSDGNEKKRNKVPFDGYRKVLQASTTEASSPEAVAQPTAGGPAEDISESDLPF